MKASHMFLSLVSVAALAVAARATSVTLNTSALVAGGTYYVDFQLNDGSQVGNGNNAAAVFNFDFGGGGEVVPDDIGLIGGASGDLSSTVWLNDTNPFNEFFQAFTAGSFLSFELALSNNFGGPVPDIFGFAILDANLFNLGTFAPASDQFLTVELNGGPLAFQAYAGVDGTPAPQIPEGDITALLVAAALLALVGVHRRVVRAA
ncbi:MAG TPA: NF038129 family PEP-CTERM protein [Lacunisphaera sp.]|nr:NF038129 family PEP-CTERM protein [Lacunisphaera sp.]